jgi:glycosyltransferase involved in cell wall biosynthesis
MSFPRVAFFSGNFTDVVDGVALTSIRQVEYLQAQGVPVRVYAPCSSRPALQSTAVPVDVPSVRIPTMPYRAALGLTPGIRDDLRRFRPDLVHLATPDLLGWNALNWATRRRIPVVTTFHTHFASYLKHYGVGFLEPLVWRAFRPFYRRCAAVYVACQSMADELRRNGLAANFVINPFGVDQTHFSPAKRSEEWRRRHGFAPADVVIVFVGRLVWEKGLKVWAEVIRQLEQSRLPHKSLVVGEGPAGAEFRRLVPNTVFTGRLTGAELGVAYASSDIFFFPSASETFGCVTVEALASGLACVAADATGSRDILRHGTDGILCNGGDPSTYFNAISAMLRSNDVVELLRRNAPRRAAEYRWDVVLPRMLEHFRWVVSRRPK